LDVLSLALAGNPTENHPMTLHTRSGHDALVTSSEERDREQRWAAWRAKGALADERTNRRAQLLAAALLGASGLWLALELVRTSPLAP
jgi:hypothetical protein